MMNGWLVLFWLAVLGPFALLIKGVREKIFGNDKNKIGAK